MLKENILKIIYKKYFEEILFFDYFVRKLYYGSLWNKQKISKRGRGNSFEHKRSILKNVLVTIKGNGNKIIIGEKCKLINVKFLVHGDNHIISIGDNVRINDGTVIWVGDNSCYLEIGDSTTIERAHIAITEPNSVVQIGKDCMFSTGVEVRSGDSHTIIDTNTGQRINHAQNINIADSVWVGANCSILKGVQLQTQTVVATGSVVTKPFTQSNIIIAGVPANIVRSSISWQRENVFD